MLDDTQLKREALLIGTRLRWARELVSVNQAVLAHDVGVQKSMINKIESGVRSPSVFLLQSLCHVLRISPQYLLWGSLQGVDGELAAKLSMLHPELLQPRPRPNPGKTRKSQRDIAVRPRTHDNLMV